MLDQHPFPGNSLLPMPKPKLEWLLVFVPIVIVLELTHAEPTLILPSRR